MDAGGIFLCQHFEDKSIVCNEPNHLRRNVRMSSSGDVFIASVVNQKCVNQTAQQVLVLLHNKY